MPDEQDLISELAKQTETLALRVEDFTCNLGTFPGSEAHNSTIALHMPFLIGETWIVGGVGSFYGNNHHCNYYNSFYATDWNKPDGNDANTLVLAVANGSVSAIDAQCIDVRYGCFDNVTNESNNVFCISLKILPHSRRSPVKMELISLIQLSLSVFSTPSDFQF